MVCSNGICCAPSNTQLLGSLEQIPPPFPPQVTRDLEDIVAFYVFCSPELFPHCLPPCPCLLLSPRHLISACFFPGLSIPFSASTLPPLSDLKTGHCRCLFPSLHTPLLLAIFVLVLSFLSHSASFLILFSFSSLLPTPQSGPTFSTPCPLPPPESSSGV